jgi:hypothetical protein
VALIIFWASIGYTQQSLGISGSVSSASAPYGYGYPSAPSFGGVAKMANDRYAESVREIAPIPPVPGGNNSAPQGNAMLIRTGTLELVVKDVTEAANAINAIRVRLGGQPGNAQFSESSYGGRTGSVTISIPSQSFDEAYLAIRTLAVKVRNESINTQDVSKQYVDLESRLKNYRASETQLMEFMKRTGTINELLQVQNQLTSTRGEIERIQGEMSYLSRQVELSTITANLSEERSVQPVTEIKDEWRPILVMNTALKNALMDLTGFVDWLITFLIALPMFLVKLGFWCLIFYVIWNLGKRGYMKLKADFPSIGNMV